MPVSCVVHLDVAPVVEREVNVREDGWVRLVLSYSFIRDWQNDGLRRCALGQSEGKKPKRASSRNIHHRTMSVAFFLPTMVVALSYSPSKSLVVGLSSSPRTRPSVALLDGLDGLLAQQYAGVADTLALALPTLAALVAQTPEAAHAWAEELSSPKLAIASVFVPGLALAFGGRFPGSKGGVYSSNVPYAEGEYDPAAADRFYGARPWIPLGRLCTLTSLTFGSASAR